MRDDITNIMMHREPAPIGKFGDNCDFYTAGPLSITFDTRNPRFPALIGMHTSVHVGLKHYDGVVHSVTLREGQHNVRLVACAEVPSMMAQFAEDKTTGIRVNLPPYFLNEGLRQLRTNLQLANHFNRKLDREFLLGAKEKPVKIKNKYYVAADKVSTAGEQDVLNTDAVTLAHPSRKIHGESGLGKWTRPTLAAAIAHAEEILDAEPNRDHVVIVKMVRIVRRKKAPIVVEIL